MGVGHPHRAFLQLGQTRVPPHRNLVHSELLSSKPFCIYYVALLHWYWRVGIGGFIHSIKPSSLRFLLWLSPEFWNQIVPRFPSMNFVLHDYVLGPPFPCVNLSPFSVSTLPRDYCNFTSLKFLVFALLFLLASWSLLLYFVHLFNAMAIRKIIVQGMQIFPVEVNVRLYELVCASISLCGGRLWPGKYIYIYSQFPAVISLLFAIVVLPFTKGAHHLQVYIHHSIILCSWLRPGNTFFGGSHYGDRIAWNISTSLPSR